MSKQIAKSLTAAAQQLATVAATLQQAAAALGAAPVATAPAAAPAAPAAPKWTPEQKKKLVQFRGAFMALGDDEKTASRKAIAKLTGGTGKNSGAAVAAPVDQPKRRGRPAGSGRAAAPAPVAPAQKKKRIHMLTLDEVREGTGMTLAQFCKTLVEDHGLDRDSEEFTALRKQFIDLRAKLKAQVEEENDVAASGEDLVDGFVVDGGDGGDDAGYDFDPEPVTPKKRGAKMAEEASNDADSEFGF